MRLGRIAYPSSADMTVTYDALTGRPDSIAQNQGTAELASFDYGYDTDGKITSIADAGGVRDFAYDATLQLTGGGYASAPESYAYDAEGNRTARHLSATYVHDTANRLREDAETCYDYDANGNLVSRTAKVAGACTGAVTSYGWDVLNRLVRIDNPDGSYAAYRYDAQGRRIGKDVNGALTRYVYDDDAILLEYDGANTLLATYSHGEEVDQPLAMARGGGSYFYHTDHLGSVRLVTDAAGTVVSRYDYDAFGNLETTSFEGVANPYGFTARERDAESGLMFYRARYYDPKIGRFISQDPIGFDGKDLNLYRYVGNESLVGTDPTGKLIFAPLIVRAVVRGIRWAEETARIIWQDEAIRVTAAVLAGIAAGGFPYDVNNGSWNYCGARATAAAAFIGAGGVAMSPSALGKVGAGVVGLFALLEFNLICAVG